MVIVKLANLYVLSFSALYTFWYVLIVKVTLVIFFEKKKQKNDPYYGMGKNTKVMPQKPHYLSFLLGKGGNPYVSKPYVKNLSKSALSPPPQQANHSNSDTVWMTHTKFNQIDHISFTLPQLSHLSSNRRVCNLQLYFQFTTPARELTHRMKFIRPKRHEFQQHHISSLPKARETPKQKGTNFGNTIILCYLEPENHQIQPQKTRISHKVAVINPRKKKKNAKESIHFSRISHIVFKCTH